MRELCKQQLVEAVLLAPLLPRLLCPCAALSAYLNLIDVPLKHFGDQQPSSQFDRECHT